MAQLVKGLLTIGIPAHNGAANFPGLFASIVNLGLETDEYELLVVDNCSNDDTVEVIEQLKEAYPNIRFYQNDSNIGRIENWNKVVALSRGEYLVLMNVNDRFLEFDMAKHLKFLAKHPEASLVMADVRFNGFLYPNWRESGLLDLQAYTRKTYLEPEYLEFHALGVLHQHIFRTALIRDNQVRFDFKIPRTTDRVFTAEVIRHGGGLFYYTRHNMISWELNDKRFHYSAHRGLGTAFMDFWSDEYEATVKIARLLDIPYSAILKSQLTLAEFLTYVKRVRWLKQKVFGIQTSDNGLEVPTAQYFANHLKGIAREQNIPIKLTGVRAGAFYRAAGFFLRSIGLKRRSYRSLRGIIKQV